MAGINFFTGFFPIFYRKHQKNRRAFRLVGRGTHSFVFSGVLRKEPGVCP